MAVSDNLPYIPFGFDGLKMMNDSDCQTVRNAKLPEMKDMVYECDKISLCLKSPELFLRHVPGIIENLDEKELSTRDNRMQTSGRGQTKKNARIECRLRSHISKRMNSSSKMTKTAKRRMQTKTKKALSFFRNHRRLLRRQGIEDLLHLAERGLIEPITAAMAVSDNLPCIPFGFDGLKMMNNSDCQTVRNAKLPEMKDMVYECDKISLCLKSPELFLHHVLGIIKNLDEKELSTQDNRMRASGRGQTKKNARIECRLRSSLTLPYTIGVIVPAKEGQPQGKAVSSGTLPTMNGRGHIDVDPGAGIMESKMGGNEESGAGGLGVLTIRHRTVDIWSVACLLWELATKTYLFDTQSKRGKDGKDEAHLAKIVETNGELSNRESLRPTKLTNLLIRCKGWTTRKATEFVDFLMPMLNTDPLKRTSACKALGSP
ncbi:uncharacterized protein LOC117147168 [Drosophila mauritiana]|uniref:non-specific serine/threonine protein kinase n=1 Tax=Drosophila mauritiana TaxID=7226 RepID=A0A6P8L1I9_DROMA|nr:uncharacterized protein LOC117147168 [Drosophila mauritiana]